MKEMPTELFCARGAHNYLAKEAKAGKSRYTWLKYQKVGGEDGLKRLLEDALGALLSLGACRDIDCDTCPNVVNRIKAKLKEYENDQ